MTEDEIEALVMTLLRWRPQPLDVAQAPAAVDPPWPDRARILRLRLTKLATDWRAAADRQEEKQGRKRPQDRMIVACATELEDVLRSEE